MDFNHFLAVQVSVTLFLETPGKENFSQYGTFKDELPQKTHSTPQIGLSTKPIN